MLRCMHDNFEDKHETRATLSLSLSLSCLLTSLDIKLPLSLFTPDPNRPLDEYVRLNPREEGGIFLKVDASIVISEFVPWNITLEDVLGIL